MYGALDSVRISYGYFIIHAVKMARKQMVIFTIFCMCLAVGIGIWAAIGIHNRIKEYTEVPSRKTEGKIPESISPGQSKTKNE